MLSRRLVQICAPAVRRGAVVAAYRRHEKALGRKLGIPESDVAAVMAVWWCGGVHAA